MASIALSHNAFSECRFVRVFFPRSLLHLIYMSNSNYLYYLLIKKRMALLQCNEC